MADVDKKPEHEKVEPIVETEKPAAIPTPATEPAMNSPKAGKSNNNLVIIIVVIVAILCLCMLCIGGAYFAFVRARDAATTAITQGLKENTSNNVTNGTTNSTDTTGTSTDSTGSVSFGGDLPTDFPKDVPIYPNSKVSLSSSDNKDGKNDFTVTFSTKAKTADVANFYKNGLTSNGWTIVSEQSIFGYSLTADKSGREITVLVIGDDNTQEMSYTLDIKNK